MSLAISMQILVKGAAALLAARKWQALRVSKSKLKVHWLSIGSGSNGSKSNQQSFGLHSSDSSHLFYFHLILLDIFLKETEMHNEVTMNQSLASGPGSQPPTSRGLWVHLLHRKLKGTLNCEESCHGNPFLESGILIGLGLSWWVPKSGRKKKLLPRATSDSQ